MTETQYYLLILFGGVEIETHGPFPSIEERLIEAKKVWQGMNPSNGDNVFWMNQETGFEIKVSTGFFINGELN